MGAGPAERSAARLAHQSGGLGVPGSNPGAPTKIFKHFNYFIESASFANLGENGTERHQSAYIGAKSPGGVPEFCSWPVSPSCRTAYDLNLAEEDDSTTVIKCCDRDGRLVRPCAHAQRWWSLRDAFERASTKRESVPFSRERS